jgi:16S rRNA (guanine527-N7)-methyltransferase
MNIAEKLARGCAELKLNVLPTTAERLLDYIALIGKWNRMHNLTAVRDRSKMVSAHLLDCLAVLPHIDANFVLDVGSGAGLPGIPLALVRPDIKVTLLDSNHKKAAFLRQAVIELGIDNADIVCERIEAWQPRRTFDLVISRAFSDLPDFLRFAGPFCTAGGTVAAMKGVYPYEELAQLPADFEVDRVVPLTVPGLSAARHLVLLKRQN